MATKKIKNGMRISGDPAKEIKRTSREVFAGAKIGTFAYGSKKDYTRKPKHKGRNIQIDC